MFYTFNKWLFIVSSKSLSKFFKSKRKASKSLESKAQSIDKHLMYAMASLSESLEMPTRKIRGNSLDNGFISRLPRHIIDRAEQLRIGVDKMPKISYSPEDSETLLFFDSDPSDNDIQPANLQDAVNKFEEGYGDNQPL